MERHCCGLVLREAVLMLSRVVDLYMDNATLSPSGESEGKSREVIY